MLPWEFMRMHIKCRSMKIPLLFTLFVASLVQVSCNQEQETGKKDFPPLSIRVEKVSRMDITDSIQIFGSVKLRQDTYVASQFNGRLTRFSLIQGDRVIKGEELGRVVPPGREALKQVMSELTDQQKEMVDREIREIPLVSPISGTVLEVMQHNGDVVDKGESIVHIANLGKLDVYGDLPVSYLPLVKPLKTLRVVFVNYPHEPLSLKISAFDGRVDTRRQTIQVRLSLDNTLDEFRPGMVVKIEIPNKVHTGALVIPRHALLEEEGIYSVFVFKDNQVEKRNVKTGIRHSAYVEVVSGLSEGELVVTEKAYSLTDGMKVRVQ